MSEQPSLFSQRSPRPSDQDVAILCTALTGTGWRTAKALKSLGYNERALRAIASASKGEVISGQRGYRLTAEASVEDVDHAESWLRSQAESMQQRAYEIRQARNRRRGIAA